MSKIPLQNLQGKRTGDYELADHLLVLDRGDQAVHDAVVAHLANRRAGTASTKTKGEVNGSNIKPWKQKGTGRARAGLRASPIWRGGGITFGPKPRSFAKVMPRKLAQLAFSRAFSGRVQDGSLVVVEALPTAAPKSKVLAAALKEMGAVKGVLMIVSAPDRNLALASRNLPRVELVTAQRASTYQLLRYPKVVIVRAAMQQLEARLALTAGRDA